jgi:uncharacterized protein DUF4191
MADEDRPGLIKGIRMNYGMTRQVDPKLPWILLGSFVFAAAVGFALFSLLPGNNAIFGSIGAVLFGLVAVLVVLGRRSQKAMYKQLEGQMGAAGRALQMLRRGWNVEVPVAFNKNQDLVHRVVGRPGIVLVGEGNPNRVRPLLASEHKKHERVVADVPVQEIVVGYGEGEVPLNRLVKHIMKLPKTTKPAEMTDILARLRALDAQGRNIPIPKGPIPTSMKGQRGNLRGR